VSSAVATLTQLTIADSPEVWAGLGFAVADGRTCVSGVEHVLAGAEADGRGIRSWALAGPLHLAGPDGIDGSDGIDGLPTAVAKANAEGLVDKSPPHPNGVVAIDHVVVITPDLARTVGALEKAGLVLRRTRDSGTYGTPMRQAFFKLGPIVLEVVGSPEPVPEYAGRPAGFFGLAFTVEDLDATAAYLGERLHPTKDAVQPGRRIATLDRAAGSTMAMAFMSPGPVDY
jgi:hypothetical protein